MRGIKYTRKKQTGFVSKFNESHKTPIRSITQKEQEFIKNFDNIQNGKSKIGVVAEWIGDSKWTIHQLYARKDYIDEIIKKHWDFNKENLIITAKDAEYILQSKNGKNINYIKQVTPNDFLLLGAKKSVSGKDIITHFPIEPKNIQYIQKLQKEMNTIKSPWLPTTTEGLGRHTANQGDFPQYISNTAKVNSKPLLPSKPLNPTTRNTPLLTTAQKQSQERVQKYFRNDEIGTKFVKNITTEDGYKALGMYKDKLITFAKNPSKNTIDHEAFHAYFDIALGKQEKNSFLNLVQKRQNLTSKIDAEEWMADTFADFVAGREAQTGLTGKFKTFFQDLAYKFKNFFGKTDKVEGLFRELEAIGKGKKLLKSSSESLSSTAGVRYKIAGDTPLKPSRKLKPSERKVENIDIQKYQDGDYHQKLEMRNQYFKSLTPTQKKVVQEFWEVHSTVLYDQDSIQWLHNARKAGLSDFDAYALNLYTDSTLENYRSLNNWLRFGADRRQGNKALSESIQEALTKLPSYKWVVHRWVQSERVRKQLEKLNIWDIFIDKWFMSTSKKYEEAANFAGHPPVEMEIVSKNGRQIHKFSYVPDENEVLFPKNTQLKLLEKVGENYYIFKEI